jgi:outer membrane protein assembly factor BamB
MHQNVTSLMAMSCSFLIGSMMTQSASADWPQFRGPNSSGIYQGKPIPTEFGPGINEAWNLSLPPGHSSPCVAGDSIYLTGLEAAQKKLVLFCINKESGAIRWKRSIVVKELERGHPSFNPASSTPASDGKRVVAYFGSFGLICFNREGDEQWRIPMPITKSYAGNATSPAIFGDQVVLYRGNHVDHFVLAVNKETGKQQWKVHQEEPFSSELACTSCPIVVGGNLILHTARSVQALDVASGKQVWVAKCATTATSTPVIGEGMVIVAAWNKLGEPALRPRFPSYDELLTGHDANQDDLISQREFPRLMIFHRPEGAEAPQNGASVRFSSVDRDRSGKITRQEWIEQLKGLAKFRSSYQTHGMLALPIENEGLVDPSDIRTLEDQGIPEVPSPLFHQGLVYFVKNGGALTCLELRTGKRVYRLRTSGRGTHYASPIIANDRLITAAGDGKITVLKLGVGPREMYTSQMKDSVYATPAISDGILYVRTHHKLFAFGEKK